MRIALLFVVLVAASCVKTSIDPVTGRTDVDIERPGQRGEDWSGTLRGNGSWTSVGGTARATVLDGKTTVTINVTGATPGMVHPWHLHDGSCATGGPIVGSASLYTPLTIGSAGTASSTATITGELNEAKKYHVNVHRSSGEMGTIIACGDVTD
jgi:hypothetical protein